MPNAGIAIEALALDPASLRRRSAPPRVVTGPADRRKRGQRRRQRKRGRERKRGRHGIGRDDRRGGQRGHDR